MSEHYVEMFDCDSARIYKGIDMLFLIIGHKRNTKDDRGQWFKNGEPRDFDYIQEKVIASGVNDAELLESAREYKRLSEMSWEQWADEVRANLREGGAR